ncbi:unnamed protein product, partial [Symbiodinium necroappetens]
MEADALQKERKMVTFEKIPKSKFGLLKTDRMSGAAQQGDDPLEDISPKSSQSSDSELAAPLEEEIAEPRLPLVDPLEDHENVWRMLDTIQRRTRSIGLVKDLRHSKTGLLLLYRSQFGASVTERDEKASIPLRDESISAYMLSELVREQDILLESLRTNFNQLKDYTDDQVAFLDCRDMHDPGKDKSTRDHLGTYPPNIHDMILNPRKSHKSMKFARQTHVCRQHKAFSGGHQYNVEVWVRKDRQRRLGDDGVVVEDPKPKIPSKEILPIQLGRQGDDKDLEKACFLFFSRVYSVFNPAKVVEVTQPKHWCLCWLKTSDPGNGRRRRSSSWMKKKCDPAGSDCKVSGSDYASHRRGPDYGWQQRQAVTGTAMRPLSSGCTLAADTLADLQSKFRSAYRKFTAVQWATTSTWDWREGDEESTKWIFFGERESQHPRYMLIFLVAPSCGSAYYVGGELPERPQGAHGVRPGERGVPARILGKDRSLGDRATQDDPLGGHRWHKQISTEIAKIRPDLLLLVYSLEDQEGLSGQAQTWLKSLSTYTKESLVLDSLGSLRWKFWFENSVEGSEREFLLFQCRGDLGCVEDHVAEAFLVEARTTFMDEQELAEEADFLDTMSDEKPRTHPVSAPPPYEFNHPVPVDVPETADYVGHKYSWLNIVDVGTSYQVVTLVRVGGGQPSSSKCLQKFMQHWVSPFGWPKVVSHDRGLHNRGAFAHGLSSHGVQIRQAGLESPEHIGKCERHGGIIKRAFKRLVKDHNVVGKDDVKKAMLAAQVVKNEFIRVGGFSPTQWALGRLPRRVGHVLDEEELGQLGVLSG